MKRLLQSAGVALLFGAVLVGCSKERVDPVKSTTDQPSGLRAIGDDEEHPNLDTICKFADSVYFRSADGSYEVNVCNDGDFFFPQIVPCSGPQSKWGWFVMYNGYQYVFDSVTQQLDSIHYLDLDFTLAPGLFCDFTSWIFTIDGTITVDQNTGFPIVGTDWSSLNQDPMRSEWKTRVPVSELPDPCFDLACKITTLQLSLFGDIIAGSEVDVWAINQFWNVTGHPAASNNEFAIHYCPFACLETVTTPTTTVCEYLPIAWPGQLPSCKTLDAGAVTGATYQWSTGATTQTISVCPTATTTYSVTISVAGEPVQIINYDVHVDDIRCGNNNGNNGFHKVWVCHVPPGNPNNPQDICIDWSGVPAHVARFRVPGMNYRQGHDSGCEIGKCGANPCIE